MTENSNAQLVAFFETADPGTVWTLIEMMDTWSQDAISQIKKTIITPESVPAVGSAERNQLAAKLAIHLRYCGSNDIAYVLRKVFSDESGVGYMEIVRDVMKLLNKQLKTKANIPRVASLADYEQIICEQIIQIQFQGKTEDEIAHILTDSGLDKDAATHAAKELAKVGITGASLVVLVRLLGKKAVTEIIKSIVIWIIARFVGKEAAQKVLVALLKKVPQKLISRFIAGVGWALLAWDITFGLAGPARRVTVPCVALISADRCMKRMKDTEKE